jgi:serine/threonine protein kinase
LALTMSTYTSEPGTRLAGRYRLVDQVNAGSGWILWKAIDETLARPVTVLTFAQGFPRVAEVVTAARAASRLNEPRLAQVFDVEDSSEGAYAVMEWVAGDTLSDLLSAGPLDAGRACILAGDAARALASAHAAGLAHLRLTPSSLHWTRTGGVKITGLGIDAALAGSGLTAAAAQDPAVTDTQGLAALMYAALTGYWPGTEETSLPPAPQADGAPCTPRQVSPDVSAGIDAVICRALLQRPVRHEDAIMTPAAFADALAAVAPPVPLPEPAQAAWQGGHPTSSGRGYPGNPNEPGNWTLPSPGQGPYRHRPSRPERSPATRGIISVVIVLVLVAIGAAAWMISSNLHSGTAAAVSSRTPSGAGSSPAATPDAVLKISGDSSYNVADAAGPGDTEEPTKAPLAIDGSSSTAWATAWYTKPNFGGLKSGAGLIINMGHPVKLSQLQVLFGTGGTNADIYLGNNGALTKAAFSTFTKVASASGASGQYTFNVNSSATGQYVVIWLTHLPLSLPSSGNPANTYQGLIYQVTARGSDATAAG